MINPLILTVRLRFYYEVNLKEVLNYDATPRRSAMHVGGWRRGGDSNPRTPSLGLTVFKTAAINHSATSPEFYYRKIVYSRSIKQSIVV